MKLAHLNKAEKKILLLGALLSLALCVVLLSVTTTAVVNKQGCVFGVCGVNLPTRQQQLGQPFAYYSEPLTTTVDAVQPNSSFSFVFLGVDIFISLLPLMFSIAAIEYGRNQKTLSAKGTKHHLLPKNQ